MKGLLYKNFMSCRLHLFAMIVVLFSVGFINTMIASIETANIKSGASDPGTSAITVTMCMTYLLIFSCICLPVRELFVSDEKTITYSFFFSTPQSAKGLLLSKYYFVLLIDLGILFGCFLIDIIVMLIMGEYAVSLLTICVILFSTMLVFMAFSIPCSVRFGTKMGQETQVLSFSAFICIIAIYALFGNISFFFEENILEALIAYLLSGKVIFVISFLPYIAVMLYYLSYRISLVLYRKGVESYE